MSSPKCRVRDAQSEVWGCSFEGSTTRCLIWTCSTSHDLWVCTICARCPLVEAMLMWFDGSGDGALISVDEWGILNL
jgi:hypothetical protein